MGDPKDLRQNVSANLRSVTQSCKGGVPIETLERDYRDLVGDPIPYRTLGYSSLEAMIRAMPDVVTLQRNAAGRTVVMAVADESTAHIASLIARQRSAAKKPTRTRRPLRARRAPVAPTRSTSARHFNKGTRALPSYLERDLQTHSRSSSSSSNSQQFHEVTKVTRSASTAVSADEKVVAPKAKIVPPSTFGSTYEVPPRFLRKQEKPLSSLENNNTEDRFNSFASNANRNVHRRIAESTVTSGEDDAYFVPPPTYRPERTTSQPEPRTAREFISNYCQKNGLACKYNTMLMGQRRKCFVSSLTIHGKKYSSYPNENLQTVVEAEEAVSEKARQEIIKAEGSQNELPVTSVSDTQSLDSMLSRIDQMVAEKPKGLWNTVVPSEYEEKFKERLPEDWLSFVKQYCSFYFDRVDDSRIILYPSSDSGRESPTSSCSNQDDDIGVDDPERRYGKLSVQIPDLPLPDEDLFDVFITNVQEDTQYVAVAVRLLDYAKSFQELSDKMKSFYGKNKHPVTEVTFVKPYAVFVYGLWHRALVEEVKGDMAICQLVDEGDLVEVNIRNLQELDSSFLQLPVQVFTFKLAELDNYSVFINPNTLREYLLGKTLVAQVVDSDRTSVILYDTSTEEDINLNLIIFEKTVAESLNYTLPESGSSAMAYLSHASPCGSVYLTFNSHSCTNLLLEELIRITSLCEAAAKLDCNIGNNCIYCAKYVDDIWYRAVVIDSDIEKKEVEVMYVDYGNTNWVPLSSICDLKLVSPYLAELPFQAVRCKLNELPPKNLYWGEKAVSKLIDLAADKELIVRVTKPGSEEELPEVSLFIRNEQSQIISINQTLVYDDQLFSKIPSGVNDRTPAWTKKIFSEFNKKEYTPQASSPYRAQVASSPPPAENATNEHNEQESLSNYIPDVAVSAEQQLAKRHGNWVITCPPVGNGCDNEEEQFPPLYPPDIPDKGNFFDIFVTMAASPFNFMCQPLKSSKDLDQLFSEMQSFYTCEENLCEMHSVLVKKGDFFAGKHFDGNWYRVRKQSIVSEDPLEVSVYYVDFGDMCILPLPNLQPLFKQFKSLPCQCMKASLKGVKPNGHDWDPLECFEFKKMVEEKQFVSIVESKQLKAEDHLVLYSLELILTDVSDPNVDVLIHEELVKQKLAQPE